MKHYYTSPLPEISQPNERTRLGQQLAKQGLINGSDAAVTRISSDAVDLTLEGQYRWGERISTMLATELDELADSGIGELPLYQRGPTYSGRGYYAIEQADVEPLHPSRRDAWQYTLSLTKEGTRADRRRTLETNISQVDHPWGNDQTAYVGVPAAAKRVQWYDRAQGMAEPTLVETRSAEHGDVDIYDATAAPFEDPTLVLDLPLQDEGQVDVSIWDEMGRGGKLDSDNIRQWRKCYTQKHDFEGEAIFDNGLVRLRFDEATPALSVERWDDTNATWTSQSLGTSDWEFYDLDIREVGLASVHASVEFRDPTQSPTAYFTVDCWVKRGWIDPLWDEGDDPLPTGLTDLLDPVASSANYEPGETKGLVDRGEL